MDYIYKDSLGKKRVGEVSGIDSIPYYVFTIKIDNKTIWCHLEHILIEWHINFIELKEAIELADPCDVLWNADAICEIFDEDIAYEVAYGIRFVYQHMYNNDVLL